MTSAAGLAMGGLHPVVALYATFLNRAFDQLLMDVALHRLPVTLVLDRAGITGQDGASHNGMWDLALLGMVPGLHLSAPRDEATLRAAIDDCLDITDGPSVVRFPKTPLTDPIPALRTVGQVDVLTELDTDPEVDVLVVAIGSMAAEAVAAAVIVRDAGYRIRVVAPRWVTPVDPTLGELAAGAKLVVTVEDGVVDGGAGGEDQPIRARLGPRCCYPGDRDTCKFPGARQCGGCKGDRRAHRPGHRASHRRVVGDRRPLPRPTSRAAPLSRSMSTREGQRMRILVVEDEVQLAEAVARGLRREGMAVDVATDGDDGYRKAALTRYDVVVLDRDLPGMTGDEICRKLRDEDILTRVIMLTASGTVEDKVSGLALGADDYLAKPFAFQELVARVRALGRRTTPAAPPVLTAGDIELDSSKRTVARHGELVDLTRKEFGVLETLMTAQGAVVSSEELLDRVWDEHADPFTTTVRVTMMTLRRKLGEPAIIDTVVGSGYRIDPVVLGEA